MIGRHRGPLADRTRKLFHVHAECQLTPMDASMVWWEAAWGRRMKCCSVGKDPVKQPPPHFVQPLSDSSYSSLNPPPYPSSSPEEPPSAAVEQPSPSTHVKRPKQEEEEEVDAVREER